MWLDYMVLASRGGMRIICFWMDTYEVVVYLGLGIWKEV